MSQAADLVITNATVHTLENSGETAEAVAVRDGRIVRVDRAYEVDFLRGVGTDVIDLEGRVLLPGFVDAHTHLPMVGRFGVHADLRDVPDLETGLERLRAADDGEGWVLGYGFDETDWPDARPPDRDALDRISAKRPVVAFREDMHVAAVNSVALERYREDLPDADVEHEDGRPTGRLVEGAVEVFAAAVEPGPDGMRSLIEAAQTTALARGVTAVHDMVRNSAAPRVYRAMDLADDLALRVRVNYWSDHLDAITETGDRTNHGSPRVRTGAIKTYTDGTIGGRTAKLSAPYVDGAADDRGQWVVPPADLRGIVADADGAGHQVAAHAIGDVAITTVLDVFAEETADPAAARHRIEHAEVLDDEAIDRMADLGVVASVQPNFLKWADEDGLYDRRLGPERRRRSNRYRDLLDAGVPVAFGSDCMPLDPLLGVHHAVNAPVPAQRLSVTEALRAYTRGAAYAGFDEDRLGRVAPGYRADLVALERSPWDHPADIRDIDVAMTIVDGTVAYDGRA